MRYKLIDPHTKVPVNMLYIVGSMQSKAHKRLLQWRELFREGASRLVRQVGQRMTVLTRTDGFSWRTWFTFVGFNARENTPTSWMHLALSCT